MLDVHPASDDRYRLWSHLTPEKVKRKSIPCSWMSLPFENALQRERERQRGQREDGQHTDLSARIDTPTLSPAGVGSPSAPRPSLDLSSMTDMVTELIRPVDRAQLDQEIEDFNLAYPVNVDEAMNFFSLPPVAGTGTAPATTTATQPVSTATQTRPVTSTRTRPVTTTTTSRPRPVTSTRTCPVTTAPTRPLTARRRAGAGTTTTTSTVTTPSGRPRIAAKQPRRRPRVPLPPRPILPLPRRVTMAMMTTRIDGGD